MVISITSLKRSYLSSPPHIMKWAFHRSFSFTYQLILIPCMKEYEMTRKHHKMYKHVVEIDIFPLFRIPFTTGNFNIQLVSFSCLSNRAPTINVSWYYDCRTVCRKIFFTNSQSFISLDSMWKQNELTAILYLSITLFDPFTTELTHAVAKHFNELW
mgnify:CR=1 FL=1